MTTNRLKDKIIRYAFMVASSFTLIIVAMIFLFVCREALPFFQQESAGALFSVNWIPVSFQQSEYGIIPLVTGTLLVTFLATLIAIPFGVGGAVYVAEVARPLEREILKPFVELLAGIPSVVLGFFGLVVVAPAVMTFFRLDSGLNAITGALVLALMAIPTIMSVSEDAIRSVPDSYRQASLALGASTQQTVWRVIVPAAIPGITAAVMLGIGRIIGETMAVLMVTGNAAMVTINPTDSVRTMTATIAAEMGEVMFGSAHYGALFVVGVVLLVVTFCLNVLAIRTFKRYGAR